MSVEDQVPHPTGTRFIASLAAVFDFHLHGRDSPLLLIAAMLHHPKMVKNHRLHLIEQQGKAHRRQQNGGNDGDRQRRHQNAGTGEAANDQHVGNR